MTDQFLDRRRFLGTSAGAALTAAMPARASGIFGAPAGNNDILVVVFLHGAMDGLNFLAPADDKNYIAARPASLRLSTTGSNADISISGGPTSQDWRLHASAAPLKPLYDAGKLAFVHASGLLADSRSHFQSIDLMERGITSAAQISSATGWLAKHMRNVTDPFAAISTTTILPERLIGDLYAVGMSTPSQFKLSRSYFSSFLTAAYTGTTSMAKAGAGAAASINAFGAILAAQPSTAPLPSTSSFQYALNTIVQLIQFKAGLQVATVELGGWDTHYDQQRTLVSNFTDLSNSLAKFQSQVDSLGANVTLVTMTEFGRRVQANASGGTDHGHGSVMMIMGNAVNGGKIYGTWPGLDAASLNLGDLNITTDYRNVIGEILTVRRGETSLASVFPTLSTYAPLGLMKA